MVQPLNGPSGGQGTATAPAGRERLADTVAETLLDAVVAGRFPTGTALPAERELATELGVNRTSLRQGLARLEQMGVVEARQGRGTVVLDIEATTDPALLARMVLRLGPGFLAELFEVRAALGALAGRLAAERSTAADHRELATALERVRSAADAASRQQAELAFFTVLVEATANRALASMMRWTERVYGGSAAWFTAAFTDGEAITAELGAISEAVASGRAHDAAEAIERYATASATRMLACWRAGSAGTDPSSG